MDKICGLKFQLAYVDMPQELEIPPCTYHVIFITEFVLLIKIPPFYEVNSFNPIWHRGRGYFYPLVHVGSDFVS